MCFAMVGQQVTDHYEDVIMLFVFTLAAIAYFTMLLMAIRAKHVPGIIKNGGVLCIVLALIIILHEDLWDILMYVAGHFWLIALYVFATAAVIIAMIAYYHSEE